MEETKETFYFCDNPKCRFHVEVPAGTFFSGQIEVSRLQEMGCLDAFDNPSEASDKTKVIIKENCKLRTPQGSTVLCEDCANAVAFLLLHYE